MGHSAHFADGASPIRSSAALGDGERDVAAAQEHGLDGEENRRRRCSQPARAGNARQPGPPPHGEPVGCKTRTRGHESGDLQAQRTSLTRLGLRRVDGGNWTIILVMSETLPLSLVKARLSELVDRVEGEDERIVVTRNGRAVAVLISADDLESLEETLVVLSDRELMRRIRAGERAAERGEVVPLDELKGRHSRGG
jgi:antitoxin YefM